MSEVAKKIPRPDMRRLLHTAVKRNLILVAISVTIAGSYMKFVHGDGNKKAYADFYKNYDADKEFERMRKRGVFDSCSADED